jgi:UDP-N-acetylmuramoyl-tripeptide--D-alanyl-D-alanine ligase
LATTLVGEHNATNLLLAALCAADLGVPPATIERRAASFHPVAHRMNVRPTSFGWLLDDVYNANPTSMAAALRALAAFGGPETRRAVVFGDMLGLGAQTDVLHDEIARLALGLSIERVYPVGDAARAAFLRTGDSRVRCLAREEISAELARDLAGAGDAVVLVKGSRGMRLELVADELAARSPRSA